MANRRLPFAWLEDRGPSLTLHAIIDDATNEVVAAVFRPTETLKGYVSIMIDAPRRNGDPLSLYSDQHFIFLSPKRKLTLEEKLAGQKMPLSTFGQALADLGITHIGTLSPQANGRKRLFENLKDRWVIELPGHLYLWRRLTGCCP